MTTITILLLAHLVADFPLQSNKIVKMKNQGNKGLGIHVAIHVAVLLLLIKDPFQYWPTILVLAAAHFITDWAKVRQKAKFHTPGFIVDQFIHIMTLIILAQFMVNTSASFPEWFLPPAIILALIPALLTFIWVIANDISRQEAYSESPNLQWARHHLHPISRNMSLVVLFLLVATAILI